MGSAYLVELDRRMRMKRSYEDRGLRELIDTPTG